MVATGESLIVEAGIQTALDERNSLVALDSKYGQLDIPNIGADEPVFILRARDELALGVLDEYIFFADEYASPEVAAAVVETKEQFATWQKEHATRLPG
jgi:hypothetical protein